MYRNKETLGDIDKGCLWELKTHILHLVDEDESRQLYFSEWGHLFEEENANTQTSYV